MCESRDIIADCLAVSWQLKNVHQSLVVSCIKLLLIDSIQYSCVLFQNVVG